MKFLSYVVAEFFLPTIVAVEMAFAVRLVDKSFGSIIPFGTWVEFSAKKYDVVIRND